MHLFGWVMNLLEGIASFLRSVLRGVRRLICYWRLRFGISNARPLNVVIGAADSRFDGWVATDIHSLDVRKRQHWESLFADGSIDRLMAEHVFEHLSVEECRESFRLCFRFLKPGGRLRIAVPDGNRRDEAYLAHVSPPKDGHKCLFTIESLSELLEGAGFRVVALEYFDRNGDFHAVDWNERDGMIMRSARFDRQEEFRSGSHYYTSLIVDAVRE